MLQKLQAAIFDMDGLMFDTERIVQYSWDIAGQRLGYPDMGMNIYHTLGMNRAGRKLYFQNKYGENFPFEQFQTYNRQAFFDRVEQEGLPVKPGLLRLLAFLRDCSIPMAVATSSSHDYACRNLEQAGISRYFSAVITGDMVHKTKPDPEIYRLACLRLNADPNCCAAFEDAPNGIRSAYAAGLYPIMVPDLVEPDEEVSQMIFWKLKQLDQAIPKLQKCFQLTPVF